MANLAAIQEQIVGLSDSEVWELWHWLGEYANERWDAEIERDAAKGLLDKLAATAREEFLAE